MFEHMEIAESIYEGVVVPSYKKPTREDSTCAVCSRNKIGKTDSSNTHSATDESSGKRIKLYAYCLTRESKTCLIHSHMHTSNEYKVLGDFGTKYDIVKHTKYHGIHTEPMDVFNRKQETNAVINNMVDDILLKKTKKSKCCEGSTRSFGL